MITTFTFVRLQPGWDREAFYQRWCEHTRDWDLRDHPNISNRLMMLEEGGEFVAMAENHWPDREALDEAIAWYETEAGQAHWRDLQEFMDAANSPTSVVTHEVDVSLEKGIDWIARPESAR